MRPHISGLLQSDPLAITDVLLFGMFRPLVDTASRPS